MTVGHATRYLFIRPVVAESNATMKGGRQGTNADTNITLTFPEAIRKDSVGTALTNNDLSSILTLRRTNASGTLIGYTATINTAKTQITINPTASLPDGAIYVAISNAYYDKDNSQGSQASATFTVDTTGPVPTFDPADDDTETDNTTNITLTFDEAIRKSSTGAALTNSDLSSILTLKTTNASGTPINYTATINSAKTIITINPNSNLADGPVYVAISNAYYDGQGNQGMQASATFTVDTTTPATTLTLSTDAAGDSAAEDAGAVTVTATLDQPAGAGGVSVTLAADNASTATASADYTLPAAFTIGEGERSATGDVTIVNDDVDEDSETIVLTTTVSGLTVTDVTLTVADNDTAGVSPSVSTLGVAMGATAGYTVMLDSRPSANVTVTPTSGTPANATVGAAVTFAPSEWNTAKTITVRGVKDGESTISHAVASTDPKYPSSLSVDDVTVTVGPQLTGKTYSITRAVTAGEGGNAQLTVSLGEAAPAADIAFDVTYDYSGSDATSADTGTTPATVTVTSGNREATLSVPIASDTEVDPNETFTVSIAPANGVTGWTVGTGGTATATVTITDTTAPAQVVLPGKPQNARATPGNAKLTLVWQAPASWGSGAAIGYEVDWYAGATAPAATSNDWQQGPGTQTLTSTATSLEFTGQFYTTQGNLHTVANGTKYWLRIRAVSEHPTDETDTLVSVWADPVSGTPQEADTTGPAKPAFNPKDDATVTDADTNITLTFAEAIKKDGDGTDFTSHAELAAILMLRQMDSNGSTIAYAASIDSAKKVITINPTASLPEGDVYVAISNAHYDATGNAGTAADITFTVDVTGPSPTFEPGNSATVTSARTNITLKFGEAIKKDGSGTDFISHSELASILTLKVGSSSGTNIGYGATINSEKTVVTIDPSANLADGDVYVAISDTYYDGAGNRGSPANITFTVDTAAPAPTFSPANGGTLTDNTANITLTFGEAIKADGSNTDFTDTTIDGILTLKTTDSGGSNIGFDATINSEKTRITINPTSNLDDGAVYVAISNAHYDGGGNQGDMAAATFTVDTPSTNANLSGLTAGSATSAGGMYTDFSIGAFAATTRSYTASVENERTHVKLTPKAADANNATVGVRKGVSGNFNTVTSGSASSAIALDVGPNTLVVRVTAEDRTTIRDYTVTVTRRAADPTVTLSALPNPVTEGAGVTVTATLSAAASSQLVIPVTVSTASPNTAEPSDVGTLTSITIASGTTSGTGTITTNQDPDENDETFTVSLGTLPSGVTAGTPSSVEVRIRDGARIAPTAAPTGLVVNAAGDGQLALAWTAPAGTVTGYDVHYTSAPSSGDGAVANGAAVQTGQSATAATGWVAADRSGATVSQTISGLVNGTVHRVRVRAVNAGGDGPWVHGMGTPSSGPTFAPPSGGGGGAAISSDASLGGLTGGAGADGGNLDETLTLTPDFDADTLEYAASVPFSTTQARLTPTAGHGDAAVKIGPRGGELAETASGEPGPALVLAVGENVFEVEVTAEDGETTATYTITVTRAPPPLDGLALRAGDDGENFDETLALTPAFDPSTADYAADTLFSMTDARLTPELGRKDATAKIGPRGGEAVETASGEPGPTFALAVGENVFEITVTAAGGGAATFTVTVTRPALPVPLDAAVAREHLFPLLVDGDGFRARLFLTNVSAYPQNACTLELRGAGLDAGRFGAHPALTVSGGGMIIDPGLGGAGVALATAGAGSLAFGYAKLTCAEPAVARLLLAREESGGAAAVANQESARPARLHRFTLPSRLGRAGLVLANDNDTATACAVEFETAAGESAGGGDIAVPAGAAVFRILDEIVSMADGETAGEAVTVTCDRPVAALAVPLTAAGVFTALDGAVPETDEEAPSRQVLPLVLDGAGFRSRLQVANLAGTANRCTLEFRGAGVNTARFPDIAGVTKDGFQRATFELAQDDRVAMTSLGRHSHAYGYATLDCEGPAQAHNLLTVGDGEEADGMAPIPPALFARELRFPVAPGLNGMALFLTNAGGEDAVCTASLTSADGEETTAAAPIEVEAESTALRFLADLFALPGDFAGGAAELRCDREIAAVALPAAANAAFAAVPPVAQGFRDDTRDAGGEGR